MRIRALLPLLLLVASASDLRAQHRPATLPGRLEPPAVSGALPFAAQRRADTRFDLPSAARPGRGAVTGAVVGGLVGALGTALYYGELGAALLVGGLAGGCVGYVVGSVVDSLRGPAPPPPFGYAAEAGR